jgi:uncharacterized protein (DUF983 family)
MIASAERTDTVIEIEHRPLGRSIKRGLLNTCPACGSGRLFRAFLKPVDVCEACGSEMFHHRSDDLPAYIVVVLTGHILLTGYLLTDDMFPQSLWIRFAFWIPLVVLLAFLIIQPIKGGVIGLQWAMRLHGFGGIDPNDPKEEIDDGQ